MKEYLKKECEISRSLENNKMFKPILIGRTIQSQKETLNTNSNLEKKDNGYNLLQNNMGENMKNPLSPNWKHILQRKPENTLPKKQIRPFKSNTKYIGNIGLCMKDYMMKSPKESHVLDDTPKITRQEHQLYSASRIQQMQQGVINDESFMSKPDTLSMKGHPISAFSRLKKENIIQRLVGFEAELSIPTMFAPKGTTYQDKVNAFLEGGVGYGKDLGNIQGTELTSDHNNLANFHLDILSKLKKNSKEIPNRKKNMTNLEYVTKASDELGTGSTKLIEEQLNTIVLHTNTLFSNNIKNEMMQIPNSEYYTGIPVAALREVYGNCIDDEISKFKDGIQNSFYLQVTAGIIPSAIRELHSVNIPTDDGGNLIQKSIKEVMTSVYDTVSNLTSEDWFVSQTEGMNNVDYDCLMGILHLVYMYMVGNAINQTTLFGINTIKNAVPFMSKMSNMRSIFSAAPNFDKSIFDAQFISQINKYFQNTNFVNVDFWVKKLGVQKAEGNRQRIPIIEESFLSDMLKTEECCVTSKAASPRTFPNPDPVLENISKYSMNEQGAQFEYRYILTRPDSSHLIAEFMKIVNQIREHNLKHVPNRKKEEIKQTF